MATAAALDEPSNMECTVCHEHFTLPKLLPCGHLLCRHCLISWLKSQPEGSCPLCRCASVDPKERKGRSLEDIADGFPTDLAMEALVEADRLLSKQHGCCVCVDVAAVFMCLTCGDMFCQSCSTLHKKQSVSKHHTVENLASLTVEKLAASRPATCAVHDYKMSEVYCPAHAASICLLCATADHRECQGVTKLETRAEEARVVLAELEVELSAGETELERVIGQLDRHLQVIDTDTQAAVAEIEATGERLKTAVNAWCSSRKKLVLSTCADVKKPVQDGKVLLLQRQGRLTSHKHVTQRVQGFSARGSFGDMAATMKTRVHDLDLSATLPTGSKVFSTVALTIDPQAVSRIEQELSQLGQLRVAPVAGAFQRDTSDTSDTSATEKDHPLTLSLTGLCGNPDLKLFHEEKHASEEFAESSTQFLDDKTSKSNVMAESTNQSFHYKTSNSMALRKYSSRSRENQQSTNLTFVDCATRRPPRKGRFQQWNPQKHISARPSRGQKS